MSVSLKKMRKKWGVYFNLPGNPKRFINQPLGLTLDQYQLAKLEQTKIRGWIATQNWQALHERFPECDEIRVLLPAGARTMDRMWALFEAKRAQVLERLDNSTLYATTDSPSAVWREPIPSPVRIFVWRRDMGRCVVCGSKEKLEYDHIIPLSKGGSSTERNLELRCEPCNRTKGPSIAG